MLREDTSQVSVALTHRYVHRKQRLIFPAACARFFTASFSSMCSTWRFTVESEMPRPVAIAWLVEPCLIDSSTSSSRGVRICRPVPPLAQSRYQARFRPDDAIAFLARRLRLCATSFPLRDPQTTRSRNSS